MDFHGMEKLLAVLVVILIWALGFLMGIWASDVKEEQL